MASRFGNLVLPHYRKCMASTQTHKSTLPGSSKTPMPPRNFALLFLVLLTAGAGNTALQAVLPAIGRSLHIADSLIATVFSVSALIWVFSAPYWASKSDRQGRKKLILMGSAAFSVSMALISFALLAGLSGWIGPFAASVAVIASRMVFGTFGSASPPAAQAMVVLQTPLEERTKALTLLSSAFGMGTVFGLALAPWLVFPVVGLAGPAIAFSLLGFVTLFLVWRYLPDDSGGDQTAAKGANVSYPSAGGASAGASITAAQAQPVNEELKLKDPRIWHWMVTGLVTGHAQAMTGAAMGFLVIDRLHLNATAAETPQAIGLSMVSGAGAALLVQWGVIPILDMKPRTMMVVGLVIAALGMLANAYAFSLFEIATSYALASSGFGFTRPAYTAGSSLAVGRRLQGLVAGRVTSVNGASYILGPTIGVGLYEIDHALPYFAAALALLLLIPVVLRNIPKG
jgi:MFS family permease